MIRTFRAVGVLLVCLGTLALGYSGSALADPPIRVARLSYVEGTVSLDAAGTPDWVEAPPNRPLVTGDSLWADANSRAELDLGRVAFRLDSQTSITVTNLDNQTAQLQLAQGTLSITVRRFAPDDVVEIDTPNLAFSITQPGSYRVNVTADGSMTLATVRNGQANVTGEGRAYTIASRASYSFTGTDLSNSTYYDLPPADDFDRFIASRESRFQATSASSYVSPDVIGYEDLQGNGNWQQVPGYGAVWTPSNVGPGWVPYRDGHWAWVDPWGWTWVDDAPWGFAPFHYGRWALIGPSWGWIPGPVGIAPVYAPALVAFVGGGGVNVSLAIGGGGGIAWFPLGPQEVYRPAYAVSAEYVRNVNVSNTNVTNTYVTTVVNNNTSVVKYVNQTAPGAVTAVPQSAFTNGQNVRQAAVPVSREAAARAQVSNVAAIAPTAKSVAPSPAARARPPAQAMARAVVARTPPPAPPISFAAKQQQLAATPGRPLEAQAEAGLRARGGDAAAVAHPVKVVNAPRPNTVQQNRPPTTPERTEPLRPDAGLRPPVARPPQPIQTQPYRPVAPAAPIERPVERPPVEARPPVEVRPPAPRPPAQPQRAPARNEGKEEKRD